MSSNESCTQPECRLREADVDSRFLAKLIVRVLAGEDVSDVVGGKSPIHPYERCVECVLQIQNGGGPLLTVDEVEDLIEAGRWSHRRSRRGEKREKRENRERWEAES
jgi:hypothetical protein